METIFDYNQIKEIIPHRQPFLLIDRVVEYDEGQRCVAIKQVSGNEPFFQGHFPEYAVMPGVLITEALAQTGAVAMLNSEANKENLHYLLVSINVVLKTSNTWRYFALRS